MSSYYLISDAAKAIRVESHVLRYWEEELSLPIRRNELGHRYYTEDDVKRFKQIKDMKERGLQLKAIKMILKDGKLDVVAEEPQMAIEIVEQKEQLKNGESVEVDKEDKVDKAKRLQWLLQQFIREAIKDNNEELCRVIKDSVVKELEYQFRVQEERMEECERERAKRDEMHYQKLDELMRTKTRKPEEKKRRHFIF